MKGFIEFVKTQGVVGLAVGFILGGSISDVVSSLVDDIIDPLLSLILGSTDTLSGLTFAVGSAQIRYGNFLSASLDFVILAFIVYYVVNAMRFDRSKIQIPKKITRKK